MAAAQVAMQKDVLELRQQQPQSARLALPRGTL